jgi:CubicO group peptidase (beta-lactamase class C family)
MKKRKSITPVLLICMLLLFGICSSAQRMPLLSTGEAIRKLESDIPRLMKASNVPGLSIALIRNGKVVWHKGFGVMNTVTRRAVNYRTVFEANSLSKPVFSYAVLTLASRGQLNLDIPVFKYMGRNYHPSDDPRFNLITSRMILSNSSGIVSSKTDPENKVDLAFDPGEKFQYSPVGFQLLSKVIEKITRLKIEHFINQAVLQPLGMKGSSYVWQPTYKSLKVYNHNWLEQPKAERDKPASGKACCSLQTTAVDYAKFVIAVMNGELLQKAIWKEMFQPQIKVSDQFPILFWGLGWGLEKLANGETFWHWGDGGDSKDYIKADLKTKNAVVFFANSENGQFFTREILDEAIGGEHPGANWLNYQRYDSPSWVLLKAILVTGAEKALQKRHVPLTEIEMNQLGYQLLNAQKTGDAIMVFWQNISDFPKSGNAWDSLAEAYMDKGDKAVAIEYYQKSLALDPANTNAVRMIQKLKQQQ